MATVVYMLDAYGQIVPIDLETASEYERSRYERWLASSISPGGAAQRRVDYTVLMYDDHKIVVSTVFLSLNHNFGEEGPPILWETCVMGAADDYMQRYTSREDAERGHDLVLTRVMVDHPQYRLVVDSDRFGASERDFRKRLQARFAEE